MQATTLQRRKIGGLEVSLTGLGCNNFGWRIDAAQSARVVQTALDSGIDFFDTAEIYDKGHSEEYLGRALAGRRREAVIATKFGMKFDETRQGARPEYVRQAAAATPDGDRKFSPKRISTRWSAWFNSSPPVAIRCWNWHSPGWPPSPR